MWDSSFYHSLDKSVNFTSYFICNSFKNIKIYKIYTHVYIRICAYMNRYVYTYVSAYMYINRRMYVYTHVHIYLYSSFISSYILSLYISLYFYIFYGILKFLKELQVKWVINMSYLCTFWYMTPYVAPVTPICHISMHMGKITPLNTHILTYFPLPKVFIYPLYWYLGAWFLK